MVTISSSRRGWKRREIVVAGRECGEVIVGEYRENGKVGGSCGKEEK